MFGNYSIKNSFNSIKKKNLPTICYFLFNTTGLQYSTHSPEFTVLKWEIKCLIVCSFIFAWSGYGSGSRLKFRIHADLDPQNLWVLKNSLSGSDFNILFSLNKKFLYTSIGTGTLIEVLFKFTQLHYWLWPDIRLFDNLIYDWISCCCILCPAWCWV